MRTPARLAVDRKQGQMPHPPMLSVDRVRECEHVNQCVLCLCANVCVFMRLCILDCVYSTVQSQNAEENFAMRQNKIYCIHIWSYFELESIIMQIRILTNKQKTLFYLEYRFKYSKCYGKMFNILDIYFYFLFFISFIRIQEAPPFCGSMRIRVRNREFNDLKINYCLQYENPASRSPNPAKFMFYSNTAHGINSAVGTRICTYASNLFSEKIIEIVFRNKVYFSVLFIIAQHRYTAEIMYCAL